MKTFVNSVRKFILSDDGPTAVEYAVMLALIILVCITAIQAIGTSANTAFQNVSTGLGGS
jgi:pilus assembly protein Flp/PilA